MKSNRLTASAIVVLWLTAGAASAQTIDWRSDANRTFWNAITRAELQELAAEAGAGFTEMGGAGGDLYARLEWPGLNPVTVRLSDCMPSGSRTAACTAMRLYIPDLTPPANYQVFNQVSSDWVTTLVTGEGAGVYRTEFLNFGTTRGHVLGTLVQFRREATAELALLRQHAAD